MKIERNTGVTLWTAKRKQQEPKDSKNVRTRPGSHGIQGHTGFRHRSQMVYVYGDDSRRIGIDIEIPGLRKHLFNIVLGIIVLIAMKPVFFETLKLSTLLVGRFIVLFACFGLLPGPIFVIIVLGLYIINILEATMTDFFKNKQYFNGVSGLFVAIGASAFFLGSTWGTTTTAYSPIYFIDGFQSSAPRSRSHPNISQIKQPYSIAQSQVQPRSESQSQLQ